MPVALGQLSTQGFIASGTTVGTSFGTNPVAGSKILLGVQSNTTNGLITISDNGTTPATWVLDKSQETAGKHAFIYRADNITLPSAGSLTVTYTHSAAAGTISIGAIEVIGAKSGAPSSTNSGTATSTAVSSGAVTGTSRDASFYVGAFSDASAVAPETITYTGPGAVRFSQNGTSGSWPWAFASHLLSGTQSAQTFTWTLGDSVSWCAVAAVYEAAPQVSVVISQAIDRASRW